MRRVYTRYRAASARRSAVRSPVVRRARDRYQCQRRLCRVSTAGSEGGSDCAHAAAMSWPTMTTSGRHSRTARSASSRIPTQKTRISSARCGASTAVASTCGSARTAAVTSVQLRGWALQHPVLHPDLPKRIGVRGLLWGDRRDVEHGVADARRDDGTGSTRGRGPRLLRARRAAPVSGAEGAWSNRAPNRR